MRRLVPLLVLTGVALFLAVFGNAVVAQSGTPPPYAGLKNPLPWGDATAQTAGRTIYSQSCQACHGAGGNLIVKPGFRERIEREPDYYFWTLSEGRLSSGMPPFKASLSETQRWQVLTYIWSLAAPSAPRPVTVPAAGAAGSIVLDVPGSGQAGRPLTMKATVRDIQGQPVGGAVVGFFMKVDFFASGLAEVGEALTNEQGVAELTFTPRVSGDVEVVARLGNAETGAMVAMAEAEHPLYEAEVGLRLPSIGKQVFIVPVAPHDPQQTLPAPWRTFRLGGITTWVLAFAFILLLVWSTYFRVVYQVFRIPIAKEITDTDTRVVPVAGLIWVTFLGILLVLMFVASPYSHLHLAR